MQDEQLHVQKRQTMEFGWKLIVYTLAHGYKEETVPFSFPNGKNQRDNSINTATCLNSYWF